MDTKLDLGRGGIVGTYQCTGCHETWDGSQVRHRQLPGGKMHHYCPKGACESPVVKVSDNPKPVAERNEQTASF